MEDACAAEGTIDAEREESPSLTSLAKVAAAGDGDATSKLLRAVAPRLVAIVRAVLGGGHPDVDDAAQQALIGFVQALPAYRGDCDPVGYGRIIAVRAALAIRRRTRTRNAPLDDSAETESIAEQRPSMTEITDASRRKETLRVLLDELPVEQAETLALRIMLGLSLEEVARQTGAPLNTVRTRIRLAKEKMKKRIEADPALLEMLGGGARS
jgi:RNA polymerase sigma-70 factor (ECF subfamily)